VGLIISFILGVAASLAIAHFYHKKGSADQRKLFKKLPSSFRRAILESRAENLSVKELNKLLEEKVFEKDPGSDPLPYKCCPKCGSTKLKGGSMFNESTSMVCLSCEECDWIAASE